MDELGIEHRLTEIEQRSKSNSHRLDKLEPIISEIHTMSKTMVQLVGEVKHTNENVSEIKDKVGVLESKPSARMEQIKTAIISAIAAALIGGIIAAFLF